MKQGILPRLGAVLLLFFGASGCSRLELAYRFADNYIVAKLDSCLDLDSEQKALARRLTNEMLQNLLRDQIPLFQSYLESFVSLARKKDLSSDELGAFSKKGDELFQGAWIEVRPQFLSFAKSLKASQFERCRLQAQEKRAKTRPPLEHLQKEEKSWLDFVGIELRKDQEKIINSSLVQALPFFEVETRARRRSRDLFFDATKDPVKLEAFVMQSPEDFNKQRSREEIAAREKLESLEHERRLQLLRSLDKDQRDAVEEKLHKLRDQLQRLRDKHLAVKR